MKRTTLLIIIVIAVIGALATAILSSQHPNNYLFFFGWICCCVVAGMAALNVPSHDQQSPKPQVKRRPRHTPTPLIGQGSEWDKND